MKAENLLQLRRLQMSGVAQLIPRATDNCQVSVVESQRVISIRHLPDCENSVSHFFAGENALQPPQAGHFEGSDPWMLWRSPNEYLLITSSDVFANDSLAALPATRNALAYALDLSAGYLIVELLGDGIVDVLPRLLDASAIPQAAGRCCRARLAEIAVIAVRLADDRVWLVADRANDRYLMLWIAYAVQASAPRP
ncbi:MAG: hypothetical protein ING75_04670 [Rhodocyclaceae bacterium]|nr:hypothetical protein [Rhodocyclaceae bacterium]